MNYLKWKQLGDEGYSSDAISLLSFLKNGEEIDLEHAKTSALYSFLIRKDLVQGAVLTPFGEELLKNAEVSSVPVPTKPKKSDKFEEWWKTYPATNGFTLNGITFEGTQSKKIKKDLCKTEFNKALKDGLDADEIIAATAFHINNIKKFSLKKTESQLTYLANSERYLRERMYVPYMGKKVQPQEEVLYKSNVI